jgi:hypothetical protein
MTQVDKYKYNLYNLQQMVVFKLFNVFCKEIRSTINVFVYTIV